MAVQRVQVDNPVGTNKDLAPSLLPPEVWTDSLNVAFRFNKTTSAPGYSSVFGDEPDGGIFYMLPATTGTDLYWYEGGTTKLYRLDPNAVSGIMSIGAALQADHTGLQRLQVGLVHTLMVLRI